MKKSKCGLVVGKMSRLEKDIEFTYGNRINWYMFFYACILDELVKKGIMSAEERNYIKSVDDIIAKKFKLYIYDKDVSDDEYGKSKTEIYGYINPSRI